MQSYGTARGLFSFLGFCAWILIIGGIGVALMSAAAVSEMARYSRASEVQILMSLLPGLGVSLLGVFGLALVQIGRASVDMAECTQQMLKVARDQLEVSRQGLLGRKSETISFGDARQTQPDETGPSFADMPEAPGTDTPEDDAGRLMPNNHEDMPGDDRVEPGRSIQYNGREIKRVGETYVAMGTAFGSLEQAKRCVDRST